jgi:PhnB protein
MKIDPYLMFDGCCEEAFKFYERVLAGKIEMMMTYGEAPEDCPSSPEMRDKIMHTSLLVDGQRLMGSDSPPEYREKAQGFSVSIGVEEAGEAERIFHALAEGGQVTMPIGETFWAIRFGMLVDRFGTPWMVNCSRPM